MLKRLTEPQLPELLDAQQRASHTGRDSNFWIYVGAILLVTLILFLWAVYVQKRKGRKLSRFASSESIPTEISRSPKDGSKKRKRRRNNRNPTLAQTGGLPPPKEPLPPR